MQRAPVLSVGLHANTDNKESLEIHCFDTMFLPTYVWSRVLAGALRFFQLTKEFGLLFPPPIYETWRLNTVFIIYQYWTLSSVTRVTCILWHHISSILYSFCKYGFPSGFPRNILYALIIYRCSAYPAYFTFDLNALIISGEVYILLWSHPPQSPGV
jgi:hypothetical protein